MEWNGPAYSRATDLVYTGAVDWCSTVRVMDPEKVKSASVGQPWSGSADEQNMFGTMDPTDRWAGWLYASDAEPGKTAWRFKAPAPLLSGVTPTAGGVLFFGDMAGNEKDDRQDRGARHRIARRRPGATKSTAAGSPWHA